MLHYFEMVLRVTLLLYLIMDARRLDIPTELIRDFRFYCMQYRQAASPSAKVWQRCWHGLVVSLYLKEGLQLSLRISSLCIIRYSMFPYYYYLVTQPTGTWWWFSTVRCVPVDDLFACWKAKFVWFPRQPPITTLFVCGNSLLYMTRNDIPTHQVVLSHPYIFYDRLLMKNLENKWTRDGASLKSLHLVLCSLTIDRILTSRSL